MTRAVTRNDKDCTNLYVIDLASFYRATHSADSGIATLQTDGQTDRILLGLSLFNFKQSRFTQPSTNSPLSFSILRQIVLPTTQTEPEALRHHKPTANSAAPWRIELT